MSERTPVEKELHQLGVIEAGIEGLSECLIDRPDEVTVEKLGFNLRVLCEALAEVHHKLSLIEKNSIENETA